MPQEPPQVPPEEPRAGSPEPPEETDAPEGAGPAEQRADTGATADSAPREISSTNENSDSREEPEEPGGASTREHPDTAGTAETHADSGASEEAIAAQDSGPRGESGAPEQAEPTAQAETSAGADWAGSPATPEKSREDAESAEPGGEAENPDLGKGVEDAEKPGHDAETAHADQPEHTAARGSADVSEHGEDLNPTGESERREEPDQANERAAAESGEAEEAAETGHARPSGDLEPPRDSSGSATAEDPAPGRLELTAISKSFPGVRALDRVDFDLRPGEVHVLLGENGAGKSTLIRVLAGVHRPDRGMVSVDGEAVRLRGPQHAEKLGIATVHQETALVPELTVAENIHLGRPPRKFGVLNRRRAVRDAAELVERTGLDLDVRAKVADLGVAERQRVEIAKALLADARFLVLDEPTAVLGRHEVDRLFALVEDLTARGVGVVFISHLLDEVARIGHRVTVLRDGAKVGEVPAGTGTDELVRMMVGRSLRRQYPRRRREPGEVRLEVRNLTRRGAFEDVSFTARAGEIVGLGGMVGAGRTELVRALFGADRYDRGEVRVSGRRLRRGSVAAARGAGLALVPEDRAEQALIPHASVTENLGLATLAQHSRLGVVALGQQRAQAEKSVRELGIRARHPSQPVSSLSGGNQQKVVIGRWLLTRPDVLLLDEPTRGVDVGARAEIYQLLDELTAAGTAVLVVSSDLPELLGLSDRVLVLADGKLTGELSRAEATQQRVLRLAVGEAPDESGGNGNG